MPFNSSDLLQFLRKCYFQNGDSRTVSIKELVKKTSIPYTRLIAVLTELEHRDEITLSLNTSENPETGRLRYEGTIRLLQHPTANPDTAADG